MRGSPVDLAAVADWHKLAAAFHRAALGKRARPEAQRFAANLDAELARLRRDILAYFASIDHTILKALIARKLKHPGLIALLARIIDAHQDAPGKGLPIGALTSQQLANVYLAGLDRLLLEQCRVRGLAPSPAPKSTGPRCVSSPRSRRANPPRRAAPAHR